ncbi:hypothetical protein LV779_39635 [Streptomyces thinghirensis]|nr:hypothetical protein [Streptomyces thinghirensis]
MQDLRYRERRHADWRRLGELDAPVICCTAEVRRRSRCVTASTRTSARSSWTSSTSPRNRTGSWAWQIPLLEPPQAQFVLMSATLGDVSLLREGPRGAAPAAPQRWSARRPGPYRSPTSSAHAAH